MTYTLRYITLGAVPLWDSRAASSGDTELDNFDAKIEPLDGISFLPDSDAAIEALQRVLRRDLPDTLTLILRRYGACGFVGSAIVRTTDGTDVGIFTLFSASKIERDYLAHPDYADRGFIPFADDEFNDRFVWHGDSGKVLFIGYTEGSSSITEVARSFDDFLKKISVVSD